MPPTYPEFGPPKYELSAPWLGRKAKAKLLHELDTISIENVGEVSIYLLIEHIRGFVSNLPPSGGSRSKITKKTPCLEKLNCPEITHGDVIVDRKSVFQGHAAEVHSLDDVKSVLAKLKENKKISSAKHNMYAYRIKQSTAKGTVVVLQDFDEDGEAHAGSRLMDLMKVMDLDNTLVIVTRW
ncbi:unnamed protein product [Diatraea saccharalis]|uniref:RWD domain-containing protein n=1 Tax=Diatraea saccharalis TaxID=40085 RepID=A0A9N9R9V3_9NEOP|nr:unnamed protein product [Diatraea saccharalis]